MLEKYLEQEKSIDDPVYLFHGSPKKLEKVIPQQSYDYGENQINIAKAVFLFPSFLKATPYAFKDTIKSNSKDLKFYFNIPNDNTFPLMYMENVNIDENMVGYVYVFKKDDSMVKDDEEGSYQYKCYRELTPIDVVEVCYKDYDKYYEVSNKKLKR